MVYRLCAHRRSFRSRPNWSDPASPADCRQRSGASGGSSIARRRSSPEPMLRRYRNRFRHLHWRIGHDRFPGAERTDPLSPPAQADHSAGGDWTEMRITAIANCRLLIGTQGFRHSPFFKSAIGNRQSPNLLHNQVKPQNHCGNSRNPKCKHSKFADAGEAGETVAIRPTAVDGMMSVIYAKQTVAGMNLKQITRRDRVVCCAKPPVAALPTAWHSTQEVLPMS